MNLNDFAERIRNVKDKGRGQLYGACPVCEANEPKGHHLYFSSGTDGRILLDCKNSRPISPENRSIYPRTSGAYLLQRTRGTSSQEGY